MKRVNRLSNWRWRGWWVVGTESTMQHQRPNLEIRWGYWHVFLPVGKWSHR